MADLAAERGTEPAGARARVLLALANLGIHERAAEFLAEARSLAERERDDDLSLEIMETAAWLALYGNDFDGAREQFTAMGDHARELGRLERVTDATFGMAYALGRARDYAAALELGIPVLDAYRAREDDGAILMTLEGCGWCFLTLADPASASSYFLEAIGLAARIDSPSRLTRIGAALGASLIFMGEEDQGTQLLAAATAAGAWFELPAT